MIRKRLARSIMPERYPSWLELASPIFYPKQKPRVAMLEVLISLFTFNFFYPTCTRGRRRGLGSFCRMISRVIGAVSPSPKNKNLETFANGVTSDQVK